MSITLRISSIGLLISLLSACSSQDMQSNHDISQSVSANIDWRTARAVTIQLTDFAFSPGQIELQAGQPIRLILINNGSGEHDFSAPDFFRSAVYPREVVRPKKGRIDVAEKTTVEMTLAPMNTGKYALECTEFMHAMFGMTGEIDVVVPTK
jgi:uncharacterized cupredoxin-like copper-binding protein